jgi:anthranilate synthase component I
MHTFGAHGSCGRTWKGQHMKSDSVYGSCLPSFEQPSARGIGEYPVAISREVLADLDTPVSAYLKVRGSGPSFLLESVEGGQNVGRYSFLGADARRVLRIKDGMATLSSEEPRECSDPLAAVRKLVDTYGPRVEGAARFDGGVVGYLSYEAARTFEQLPVARNDPLELPDAIFLDIDTLLIFDHVRRSIRIVSHVWPDQPLEEAYHAAVRRIEQLAHQLEASVPSAPLADPTPRPITTNVTQEQFEAMVRAAKEHITCGDILQVVLSQRLSMPFEGDPFGLYRRLRTVSPAPYLYYVDFVDHQLVGASPELLIQAEGARVTARPIAGTRPRGTTDAQDVALADDLRSDEKERAEHLMLVDLARNDVGRIATPGTVQVSNFMSVERFSHVMHLVSDVTGTLNSECTSYDALRAAFPAGTVSGAPKIRAMQIIAELENDRRGPYAGAVGFVSKGGDMETAITIRTGVVKDGTLHVQAGAGIVADSIPSTEWRETMNKARALIEASGGNP